MTVATLIEKLKSKKQTAERSTFGHYLTIVKELASGVEIDADEAGHVLAAASKSESDLERDVATQTQRLAWHATRLANQKAVADRLSAEAELATAQEALQAAYNRLMPAVDAAQTRLHDANLRHQTSLNADDWLCGNIIDSELLERERTVSAELRNITQELTPLKNAHTHKQALLSNLETRLAELRSAASVPWLKPVVGPWLGRVNADIHAIESRIADVKSELKQLDSAIDPRLSRQRELQKELSLIHQQKLIP